MLQKANTMHTMEDAEKIATLAMHYRDVEKQTIRLMTANEQQTWYDPETEETNIDEMTTNIQKLFIRSQHAQLTILKTNPFEKHENSIPSYDDTPPFIREEIGHFCTRMRESHELLHYYTEVIASISNLGNSQPKERLAAFQG